MIIAVEGLDGVGKTTFGRMFAEAIGGTYVRLPPPELVLVSTALFVRHDSLARYLYYLSGVAAIADAARTIDVVVADRFVASAHALHLHVPGEAAERLRVLPLPHADLTFYLSASEAARRQRLELRGCALDPFESALDSDAVFRDRVAERLRSYPNTYVLDTTDRSPEALAHAARAIWVSGMNGGQDVAT